MSYKRRPVPCRADCKCEVCCGVKLHIGHARRKRGPAPEVQALDAAMRAMATRARE